MFSQTLEYALRAAAHLADTAPNAQTTRQIAEATLVPKAYLSKVLQELVAGGIVCSRRGVGGGMMLAKSPAELTILEVVSAVDPIQRIHECPIGRADHAMQLCPLHRRLDEAMGLVENAFQNSSLADVLAEPSAGGMLCQDFGIKKSKKGKKKK